MSSFKMDLVTFFSVQATWHACCILVPNQGSDLCPLKQKHSLNHWMARGVPLGFFNMDSVKDFFAIKNTQKEVLK